MGQEARRLIRVDIGREYTEALALAEADYTATLADAGYTASRRPWHRPSAATAKYGSSMV
jgi:hypothetical protein